MLLSSRRTLLTAMAGWTSSSFDQNGSILSFNDIADIIINHTPTEFRKAIATSGCFLYRGESIGRDEAKILMPDPDLLLPGTYEDPKAIAYFECLERRLAVTDQFVARPSNGHIGTSDITEASQWGEAVSIWPLGNTFSYVWPKNSDVFFPTKTECPIDELLVDQGLDLALRLGREVLFASAYEKIKGLPLARNEPASAFLAVPTTHNKKLLSLSKKNGFTR